MRNPAGKGEFTSVFLSYLAQDALMESIDSASTSCSCKVERCATCLKCSRCGCAHDGVPVAQKVSRKPGRPKKGSGGDKCLTNASQSIPSKGTLRRTRTRRAIRLSTYDEEDIQNKRSAFSPLPSPHATVQDLEKAFGWFDGRVRHNMPSKELRTEIERRQHIPKARWTHMVGTISRVVEVVSQILYPAEPLALREAYFAKVYSTESKKAKIGQEKTQVHGEEILSMILEAERKSSKNSVESRILRALLSALPRSLMQELGEQSLGAQGDSYRRAKEDLEVLLEGCPLEKKKRSLKRYDTEALEKAVQFIYSPSNIEILSWGTKTIKIDGEDYLIPSLCRKRNPKRIYEGYLPWCKKNGEAQLTRSAFLNILTELTGNETRIVRSVNYVTGFLVNDNVDRLFRLVRYFGSTESAVEDLLTLLRLAKAFLKYQFDTHVLRDHDCPSHSILHSLGAKRASPNERFVLDCSGCKFPFWVIHKIKGIVDDDRPDANQVLEDATEKFQLFMGHRIRVVNQQLAINGILERMKNMCEISGSSDEAMVILDYKMKFEALYFREKTVEHYGKRGISWHGAMLQYFVFDEELKQGRKEITYFDDVSFGDNLQDSAAVISLIECILIRVRKMFPKIKRITLQSDNASCYQSADVLLMIPILSIVHGVRVERFIHTGTQDGKSSLDAHFATYTEWIKRYVQEGNNALTASQLFTAMSSNGGLPNTVVNLIQHDRSKTFSLLNSIQPNSIKIGKEIRRASDAIFNYTDFFGDYSEYFGIENLPAFDITCHAYANIGQGVRFRFRSTGRDLTLEQILRSQELADYEENLEKYSENLEDQNEYNFPLQGERYGSSELSAEAPDEEELQNNCLNFSGDFDIEGPVTGVKVLSQRKVSRLQRRWKHPENPSLNDVRVDYHDVGAEKRHDMLSHAKRHALQLLGSGTLGIRVGRECVTKEFTECENFEVPEDLTWGSGWAARPKHGAMYGRKYIEPYREDIRAMFEGGLRNSGNKKSAACMYEAIVYKYPDRFDIPSEGEVRTELQRLLRYHKEGRDISEVGNGKRGRKGMEARYATAIEEMLAKSPKLKPREGLRRFKQKFSETNTLVGFPTDKQVLSKISSLKQAKKKRNLPQDCGQVI